MATRKPAQEDDFGFVPRGEEVPFTPEEKIAAEKKMGSSAFPTMESEEDFGFSPNDSNIDMEEPTSMSLEEMVQTGKDVLTTLPQGVTTWADEIQAAAQAAGKKAIGEKDPWMDIYEQDVYNIRQDIGEARERSPLATTLGEIGVGIGTSLIPGILPAKGLGAVSGASKLLSAGKLSGIKGMAARGAFEGAGATETMDPYELATFAGGGAILGGAGAIASQGAKALTTQDPNKIRASVLGAKSSQFKEIGIKEREKLAREFNEMGLFGKYKSQYDPNLKKWVSVGSKLEDIEEPTRDKLLKRIDDAFDKTQEEKEKLLAPVLDKPISNKMRLMSKLDDDVKKFIGKRSGMSERETVANKELAFFIDDLQRDINNSPNKQMTVEILERAKARLKEDVGTYGKDPLLGKVNDLDRLYKDFYTTINDTLDFEIQNKTYKELNQVQQKLYTAKADLKNAMASESPTFKLTDIKSWGSSPETQLDIASAADVMNLPGLRQSKRALRLGTSELPFAALRFIDPSIPMPSEQEGPYRMPQSIDFSPKDVIGFKIPRSTQAIMENKDMVLAKLVQNNADPMMVDAITEGLNGSGEEISKVIPLIINQMPTLFEKRKYNTFDGKFLDPNDRARAADDISKKDDLNSIQKAKMINKINKTGEVPEGL